MINLLDMNKYIYDKFMGHELFQIFQRRIPPHNKTIDERMRMDIDEDN